MKLWLQLLLISVLGGLIGLWSGVPVGGLLGTLLFVAVIQFYFGNLPKFSSNQKRIIQILLGGNIGLSFSSDSLTIIHRIMLPILLIPIIQLAIGLIIGCLLMKLLKYDLATALCSAIPAGMSEITFLAEAYHANVPLVITIHILRVFFIVIMIPFLVLLVL